MDFDDIKVRIRNADGRYLAGDSVQAWFSADSSKAQLFDYLADEVEARLALIARAHGPILEAVPVEPNEFLETCDQCHRMVTLPRAFFDGKAFLCRSCKRHSATQAVSAVEP